MPSSQNLVPTGGPYGSRQETVGLMQEAGLPLAVSAAGSSPPMAPAPAGNGAVLPASGQPVPGAPLDPLELLRQHSPDEFGFLGQQAAEAPPAQPTGQPDSTLATLTASAQSSFARAVLVRLNQRGR